jgi:hypothetical protein
MFAYTLLQCVPCSGPKPLNCPLSGGLPSYLYYCVYEVRRVRFREFHWFREKPIGRLNLSPIWAPTIPEL